MVICQNSRLPSYSKTNYIFRKYIKNESSIVLVSLGRRDLIFSLLRILEKGEIILMFLCLHRIELLRNAKPSSPIGCRDVTTALYKQGNECGNYRIWFRIIQLVTPPFHMNKNSKIYKKVSFFSIFNVAMCLFALIIVLNDEIMWDISYI